MLGSSQKPLVRWYLGSTAADAAAADATWHG